jgi:hypothetical protein
MTAPTFSAPQFSLADISTAGAGLPNRGVAYGLEGTGKTSLGACAPKPVFLMTRGETGLLTLIDKGRVPRTAHFPEVRSWPQLLGAIEALTREPHEYKTLVIDTLNGAERLAHEYVCDRDFGGNWGRDGFTSFMTGYDIAQAEWRALLDALDRLRATRQMSILALAHAKIAPFRNPEGNDYDRFTPDLHHKTWALTHKWSDLILFINFVAHVDARRPDTRGKAVGGTRRVLFTTRTAAFDAKNRHGLPDQIDGGSSASEMWSNLVSALQASNQQQPPPADGQQATADSQQSKE